MRSNISTFSPTEISNLISNIFGLHIVSFVIPSQVVGLFLLIIGLFIVIVYRIVYYHEKMSQNIITGLLSCVQIVNLLLFGLDIQNVIIPLLSFTDKFKNSGYIPGTLIPLDKFFYSDFIGSTTWLVLWIIEICFFFVFYFYMLWQKNVNTIGRFFILGGYFFLFISFGMIMFYMIFTILGNYLGVRF